MPSVAIVRVTVVGVFLSISKLGLAGALTCSTTALACASVAMLALKRLVAQSA